MHEAFIQADLTAHDARPGVLVVSDVILYREGIARGLELAGRHRVAATSAEHSALAAVARNRIDIVLLDASTLSVLEIARVLRNAHPALPVVGFGIGSDDVSLACAEAGLRGFVGRDGSIADLLQTIDHALTGEVHCSSRFAAMLCDRVALLSKGERQVTGSPLTPREHEIAELVSEGLSNKEIALSLKIGPATVKNHIHSILEKLSVSRRSGIAARLALLRPGRLQVSASGQGDGPAIAASGGRWNSKTSGPGEGTGVRVAQYDRLRG